MASLGDMEITVKLTDKAQLQLDVILARIEMARVEIAAQDDLRQRLERAREKLTAMAINERHLQTERKKIPTLAIRKMRENWAATFDLAWAQDEIDTWLASLNA